MKVVIYTKSNLNLCLEFATSLGYTHEDDIVFKDDFKKACLEAKHNDVPILAYSFKDLPKGVISYKQCCQEYVVVMFIEKESVMKTLYL